MYPFIVRIILVCVALGLIHIPPGVQGQDIVLKDDFDSETLSPIWMTRKLSEKGLRHISSPTRTGTGAIEICVFPGDMTEIGGDGQVTERAELREEPMVRLNMGVESWYAFSFYIPAGFPIVDTRLVIASWKQSCEAPWKKRNPMVALRYMGGALIVTVARDRGTRKVFEETIDLRNQWTDMVFHLLPKASKKIPRKFKDGRLQVWRNGKQIVNYRGALGFTDDEDEIYFKLSLYRDQMDLPMRIVFDRFRRGNSFDAVSISKRGR